LEAAGLSQMSARAALQAQPPSAPPEGLMFTIQRGAGRNGRENMNSGLRQTRKIAATDRTPQDFTAHSSRGWTSKIKAPRTLSCHEGPRVTDGAFPLCPRAVAEAGSLSQASSIGTDSSLLSSHTVNPRQKSWQLRCQAFSRGSHLSTKKSGLSVLGPHAWEGGQASPPLPLLSPPTPASCIIWVG
jgi:hypothetical protein